LGPELAISEKAMRRGLGMLDENLPNVVAYCGIEENWVLGNNANCLPQALLRDIRYVLAVDEDASPSLSEVVKPIEKLQNGRFAHPRFAYKGNRGALRYLEGNAVECRGSAIVREADVL
jgi:hypothetical protein